jgi:protein phosphatase
MAKSDMTLTSVVDQYILQFAEECHPGVLQIENKDSLLHKLAPLGDLMIVSYASGANEAPIQASRIAAECIYRHMASLPASYPPQEALRDALSLANAKILSVTGPLSEAPFRSGVAVAAALVRQEEDGVRAWIAHVGDCRAYVMRAGRLYQLTRDHTVVHDMLLQGLLTPEEAENHPEALALSRSLGRRQNVEIDVNDEPLGDGDILLLCTDGLWRTVPEEEIEKALYEPAQSAEAIARKLLVLALGAGAQDNVALEMVRVARQLHIVTKEEVSPMTQKWILRAFLLVVLLVASGLALLAYLTIGRPF